MLDKIFDFQLTYYIQIFTCVSKVLVIRLSSNSYVMLPRYQLLFYFFSPFFELLNVHLSPFAHLSELNQKNIRIFHGCEVRREKSIRGSLFGITRLCQMMPNSDPEGRIFLSTPNTHDRFFLSHTFWSPAFDFSIEVTINKSRSFMLTSTILKVDVICDITMTSTPNVLTTEVHDVLYNKCIDNTWCCLIFIYPTCRTRICNLRFVNTGEKCRKPSLVCKKVFSKCMCIISQ